MKEKRTKSETTQIFASRLHKLVEEQRAHAVARGSKLSDGKIADNCGINRPAFNKYLHNDSEIGVNSLVKIARYFNVSTDYLLGLTNASPADLSERELCEATGLNEKALDGLCSIMLRTPTSTLSGNPDIFGEFDHYLATKADEFTIGQPPILSTKEEHGYCNTEPSRKTVINALLASTAFAAFIDTLREYTDLKVAAFVRKQFRDIYPYSGANIDAYNDRQNDRFIMLKLLDASSDALDVIVKAYIAQNQCVLNAEIEKYKEQVKLLDEQGRLYDVEE